MKILSTLKHLNLAIKGGLRLNKDQALSGEELNWVLVGSMYALQDWAYLNSYQTGLNSEQLKILVEQHWQIHDRDAALEILNHLLKRNRSGNLKALYVAYEIADYPDYLKFNLHEDDEEIVKEYIRYFDELKLIAPQLIEKEVFPNYEVIKKVQDSGWNLAQASFLARCCFDLGLLEEHEMKIFLKRLYDELKTHCDSWREYAGSFILGRTIEGWPNLERTIWKSEKLFSEKRSPLYNRERIE